MRISNERCYVLHSIPFSETSLVAYLFSRNYGRLNVLAKGARRVKSQFRGKIRPFAESKASWKGRGSVPTLVNFENQLAAAPFAKDAFYCHSYVNELISRLVPHRDPCLALYDEYHATIQLLAEKGADQFSILRVFETNLLRELGYELSLKTEDDLKTAICADRHYIYKLGAGACRSDSTHAEAISGRTLIAIQAGKFDSVEVRQQSRALLARALEHYLEGRKIASRNIFRQTSVQNQPKKSIK